MAGHWLELDLDPGEVARLEACAARQGRTTDELVSKLVRQQIALNERLGARVAFGPDSLDIREVAQ